MNTTTFRPRVSYFKPVSAVTPVSRALALAFLLPLAASTAYAQNIGTIQGASHLSPMVNTQVSNIAGIVTARDTNGFWIQDSGDNNALTSDAVYVFNSTLAKPLLGDSVLVTGRVQEFRPGRDRKSTRLNSSHRP